MFVYMGETFYCGLNEMSKQRKQRTNWSNDSEVILINLWRDKYEELCTGRNSVRVHEEMAAKLNDFGYNFTKEEVKIKLHNLSNKYKKEKKAVVSSGTESSWEHYTALHEFMGSRISIDAEDYVEDSILVNMEDMVPIKWEVDDEIMSSPHSSPTPPNKDSVKRKNNKKDTVDKLDAILLQMDEASRVMRQAEVARLEALKQYTSDFAELKCALVDYLHRH